MTATPQRSATQHPIKTVAQKMGVREGMRTRFEHHCATAPTPALDSLGLPRLEFVSQSPSELDYLHLFVTSARTLDAQLDRLRDQLRPRGMLWVSWPRGRRYDTDLTLPEVIRIVYNHSLVESTCLRIDGVWSGLKCTHPKPGKTYQNSHGKLPD